MGNFRKDNLITFVLMALFLFGVYNVIAADKTFEPTRRCISSVATSTVNVITIAEEAKKCYDQGGDYMAYRDQGEKELTQRCKVSNYIDLTK